MSLMAKSSRIAILVIDDDKDIVQTIKGNLELDGYEVLTAFDGRTGLDTARAYRPNLLILDLNLPDIDGIRVCQIMRREFDFPIIMLTARDGVSDRVLGLECGADDYVVKPFSFLELSARIKAILKRTERSLIKDRLEIRDLSIDSKSRRVFVQGEEIRLTKTEFELLELFVSFPDEVLSREFIQTHVWRDSQLYVHSRAIDVHIQRLRKKIEPDIENPQYIITVAGVGYKFRTR
jgi:DNA-binding response OmpR family regulator